MQIVEHEDKWEEIVVFTSNRTGRYLPSMGIKADRANLLSVVLTGVRVKATFLHGAAASKSFQKGCRFSLQASRRHQTPDWDHLITWVEWNDFDTPGFEHEQCVGPCCVVLWLPYIIYSPWSKCQASSSSTTRRRGAFREVEAQTQGVRRAWPASLKPRRLKFWPPLLLAKLFP